MHTSSLPQADAPAPASVATAHEADANAKGGGERSLDSIDIDVNEATLYVPPGAQVDGDLLVAENVASVVIAGRVSGKVSAGAQPIAILRGGIVTGPISSKGSIIIAGEVQGSDARGVAVRTGADLVVAESGVIAADVEYRTSLCWYEGCMIHGRMLPLTNAQRPN